jgi:hypothetical protein
MEKLGFSWKLGTIFSICEQGFARVPVNYEGLLVIFSHACSIHPRSVRWYLDVTCVQKELLNVLSLQELPCSLRCICWCTIMQEYHFDTRSKHHGTLVGLNEQACEKVTSSQSSLSLVFFARSFGGCVHWTPPFLVDLVYHFSWETTPF